MVKDDYRVERNHPFWLSIPKPSTTEIEKVDDKAEEETTGLPM